MSQARRLRWTALALILPTLGFGCASSTPNETAQATPNETARLAQENVELRRDLLVERMERERMAGGRPAVVASQPSPATTPQPPRPTVETGVAIVDDTTAPVEFGGTVEEIDVEPPPIEPSPVGSRTEDGIAVEVLPANPSVANPSVATQAPAASQAPATAQAPDSPKPTDQTATDASGAGATSTSSTVPGPGAVPGPAPGTPTDQAVTAEGQALYDQAYSLFHRRQYAESEAGFRRFLDANADTHLADNALFWIGESRLARGDAASALEAFADTVERYPNGNKVADALLSGGRCLERLDRGPQAAETYREVLRRFPDSAAALTAEDRLAALGTSR